MTHNKTFNHLQNVDPKNTYLSSRYDDYPENYSKDDFIQYINDKCPSCTTLFNK